MFHSHPRALAALLAASLATLSPASADHVAQCIERTLTAEVGSPDAPDAPPMPPKLADLARHIAEQSETQPHGIVAKNGEYALNIGLLKRSQKRFMALVLRAVDEGNLKRIHGGVIMGPKALIVIDKIRRMTSRFPVEIDGLFFGNLVPDAREQIANQLKGLSKPPPTSPEYWTPSEIADFEAAVESFGLNGPDGEKGVINFTIVQNSGKSVLKID